jgi:hypothetical protein
VVVLFLPGPCSGLKQGLKASTLGQYSFHAYRLARHRRKSLLAEIEQGASDLDGEGQGGCCAQGGADCFPVPMPTWLNWCERPFVVLSSQHRPWTQHRSLPRAASPPSPSFLDFDFKFFLAAAVRYCTESKDSQ